MTYSIKWHIIMTDKLVTSMKTIYPKEYLLSNNEQKLLRLLERGSLSVSGIAKRIKIPRTTLYTSINSLLQRNLISSQRISKENILHINFKSPIAEDHSVEIFRGANSIINQMALLLTDKRYHKVKNIETIEAIKKAFDGKTVQEIIAINKQITSVGQIIESVLEEDYIEAYKKLAGDAKSGVLTKSLIGRPHNTSFLNRVFLQPYIQIMIYPDLCMFINWKSLVAYKYKDIDTVDFYDRYFQTLKEKAHKIDINNLLRA